MAVSNHDRESERVGAELRRFGRESGEERLSVVSSFELPAISHKPSEACTGIEED